MKILAVLFLFIFSQVAFSATKKALVVGSNFFFLQYAVKDSEDVAAKLQLLGFDVDLRRDLRLEEFKAAIESATANLGAGDTFLFYYSGHAIQFDGVNYLVPNDANISADDIEKELLNINFLIERVKNPALQKIIILDACRNLPSNIDTSKFEKGIQSLDTLQNSFTAYSTTPGFTAADRYPGIENSPFTNALLKNIENKGDSIDDLFNTVRANVLQISDSTQVPWSNSSLFTKFCFAGCESSGGNNGGAVDINNPPAVDVANKIVLKKANDWLLEMTNSSVAELSRYYSFPILNYFDHTNCSREDFIKEMRGYFGMWTKRTLDLKELQVTNNTDGQKKIFVNLVYKFNFTNAKGKEVKGRSINTFVFEWIKGKYLITNVTEKIKSF
jgi:hypothetical protein